MKRKYVLNGVNINKKLSNYDTCLYIEKGLRQLEEILNSIDLGKKEDETYFKVNLEILKRFYEKLDRDLE